MEQIKEIEGISLDTYAGKAALACRNKLRGIFSDNDFTMLHLMDVVAFIMQHDKLASKGYFITNDNRDDVYIKILESGDMQLFSDLEKYISYFDIMTALSGKVEEYNKIIDQLKLNVNSSEDDINNIVKSYLTR